MNQMFCSLITDSIVKEIKCDQCLFEIVNECLNENQNSASRVTLFCFSAEARCSAPCGPILFQERFNVISVC
jgi:hypothetical protein